MNYSVFNSKDSKRRHLVLEGEPPIKKSLSTAEMLVQELSRKQLSTKVSIEDHLNMKKEFQSGEKYVGCTNDYSGESSLMKFQEHLNDISYDRQLKRSNVSDNEIKLYKEYKKFGIEIVTKQYKNINPNVLHKQIEDINNKIESSGCHVKFAEVTQNISRHNEEYLNAVKPDSDETKLLKFALNNNVAKEKLPHPLDELPEIEKAFSESSELFSNCDIKRIRKKARNLQNKIDNLDKQKSIIPVPNNKLNTTGQTLWDCKTKADKTNAIKSSKNPYLCQSKKLYTINNRKIIKLSDSDINKTKIQSKLTVEDIKNISKFENYEAGIPNKVLYVKNMANNWNEDIFKRLLEEMHVNNVVGVKIMKGKMRGQCFIEFNSIEDSNKCLDVLNGVVIGNKPLIVQFSKS